MSWDVIIVKNVKRSFLIFYILIYTETAGVKTYYHQNAHGDVILLTDGMGNILKTYEYDAFGREWDALDTDNNPFRYCGEYFDKQTETVYLRARYYDSAYGRFTQQDGWEYVNFGDPLSLNLYTYCWNNPGNLADPTGCWPNWKKLASAVLTVAVGVVALATVVATGGAATPLVAAGLYATAAAGVACVGFGAADAMEAVTGINVVKDVMGGIMSKLGLSGRAFIPMILGFGCTVPAIMASRTLENRRDRFKVMLITPFMSCSARLPIYILFAEMFFADRAMLVAYSMYLIGLVVAILVAAVIHLIDRKTSENYLLIELPEYKAPSGRTVAIYVWEKVKDYLTKAGTTIFMASILMWAILNFGPHGYTTEMTESFGAILGHWLVPFFAPIGLGFWQIAVALIAGISAKEVVVSSCAVLFGVPNINSGAGMNTLVGILGAAGFGQLNAFCLMIFCLLYIPCAATLATIRKEAASTRWMLLSALFQLVVAWVVTFAVYRIGLLL